MKTHSLACLAIVLLAVCSSAAQEERAISREKLAAYFRQSENAVGNFPFRDRTVIEFGETRNGPWTPYSSWIMEAVRPDRSRITYTSGRFGEFIHIGKVSFAKELDGTWAEKSTDIIHGSTASPSAAKGFSSNPHNSYTERIEGDTLVVTVLSKKDPIADATDTKNYTYHYYFDNKGILIRHIWFGHNGQSWVKRVENYEYDPNIRIEVPVD